MPTMCNNVDFPAPDGPMIDTNSPGLMSRSIRRQHGFLPVLGFVVAEESDMSSKNSAWIVSLAELASPLSKLDLRGFVQLVQECVHTPGIRARAALTPTRLYALDALPLLTAER